MKYQLLFLLSLSINNNAAQNSLIAVSAKTSQLVYTGWQKLNARANQIMTASVNELIADLQDATVINDIRHHPEQTFQTIRNLYTMSVNNKRRYAEQMKDLSVMFVGLNFCLLSKMVQEFSNPEPGETALFWGTYLSLGTVGNLILALKGREAYHNTIAFDKAAKQLKEFAQETGTAQVRP